MSQDYLTSYQAAKLLNIPYQKFLGMLKKGEFTPLTRLNQFVYIFDKNKLLNIPAPPLPMVYGIKDVMRRTGRCKNTIWNYVNSGKLVPSLRFPSIKGGGFQFGFTEDDISRFQQGFVPKFERGN